MNENSRSVMYKVILFIVRLEMTRDYGKTVKVSVCYQIILVPLLRERTSDQPIINRYKIHDLCSKLEKN